MLEYVFFLPMVMIVFLPMVMIVLALLFAWSRISRKVLFVAVALPCLYALLIAFLYRFLTAIGIAGQPSEQTESSYFNPFEHEMLMALVTFAVLGAALLFGLVRWLRPKP